MQPVSEYQNHSIDRYPFHIIKSSRLLLLSDEVSEARNAASCSSSRGSKWPWKRNSFPSHMEVSSTNWNLQSAKAPPQSLIKHSQPQPQSQSQSQHSTLVDGRLGRGTRRNCDVELRLACLPRQAVQGPLRSRVRRTISI